MRRRLLPLAAALLALATSATASAAPKRKIAFRLDYERPEPADQCPDEEQLGLMLAAEFGYVVVRTDVSAVLTVQVRRVGSSFQAELRAPHPSGNGQEWHRTTEKQGTCQELAYDVATLVKLGLGPLKWGGVEPPPVLAAPPEIEVRAPAVFPVAVRPFESLVLLVPHKVFPSVAVDVPSDEKTRLRTEATIGPAVSPLGLPSFAIGGAGMIGVRWPLFAIGLDIRGVVTPVAGLGPQDRPVRTSIFTGSLLPCARASFVDFCGVIALSRTNFHLPDGGTLTLSDGTTFGLGGRLAARWSFTERYSLLFYGDAVADFRRVVVRSETASGELVEDWRSPPVRLVFGVSFAATLPQ